jgi:hypothetical protein
MHHVLSSCKRALCYVGFIVVKVAVDGWNW